MEAEPPARHAHALARILSANREGLGEGMADDHVIWGVLDTLEQPFTIGSAAAPPPMASHRAAAPGMGGGRRPRINAVAPIITPEAHVDTPRPPQSPVAGSR